MKQQIKKSDSFNIGVLLMSSMTVLGNSLQPALINLYYQRTADILKE